VRLSPIGSKCISLVWIGVPPRCADPIGSTRLDWHSILEFVLYQDRKHSRQRRPNTVVLGDVAFGYAGENLLPIALLT
jgi:hypothetical protein